MGESAASVNEALARALRLIAEHPAMKVVAEVGDPETGAATVEVAIQLGLPNAWMADGGSPNGVRAIEPVTLEFPAAFPLKPPRIRLRADFDRSLAHVNPGPPEERPVPCIYDGNLAELLQQQGFAGILNQLVVWLENAALGRLIDEEQGWEPVRRDELDDVIIADATYLRSLVSRQDDSAFFRFEYFRYRTDGGGIAFYGSVDRQVLRFNARTVGSLFEEKPWGKELDTTAGRGLAIFVWPGKQPSGEPFIARQYQPETVTNLASLKERAADYGCARPFRTAFDWLQECKGRHPAAGPFAVAVILCARRPFHMIGEVPSKSVEMS